MQTLIEETRQSTLIFVASGESTKSTPFHGLRRVRQPVSRAKLGVQGKVADVFNARSRHAESLNELHAFRILLATAQADAWQEQPCILQYHQGEDPPIHAGSFGCLGSTPGIGGNQGRRRG